VWVNKTHIGAEAGIVAANLYLKLLKNQRSSAKTRGLSQSRKSYQYYRVTEGANSCGLTCWPSSTTALKTQLNSTR